MKGFYKNKKIFKLLSNLLNVVKMLTSRGFLDKKKIDENFNNLKSQITEEQIFKIKSDFSDKYYHIMFVYGKLTTIKKIQGLDNFLLHISRSANTEMPNLPMCLQDLNKIFQNTCKIGV